MTHLVALVEAVLFVALVTMVVAQLTRRRILQVAALVCAVLVLLLAGVVRSAAPTELEAAQPRIQRDSGYVSSERCLSCHPSEYASWRSTYHRTMTQPAEPRRVLAPFAGESLRVADGTFTFLQHDGGHWIRYQEGRRVELDRVVMMTGSHHFQLYWILDDRGVYEQVPAVWLIADRRWIPNHDSFLRPPEPPHGAVWNDNCIECHVTGGRPQMRFRPVPSARSSLVELGIACEACHGPAARHVQINRDPMRRYGRHLDSGGGDSTIVNPVRLDHRRASEVCGRCHSISEMNYRSLFNTAGPLYRPGGSFDEHYRVVRYQEKPTDPWLKKREKEDPVGYHGGFWADGTARVAGREYNGLIASPCFTRGKMSCFSCHSMHGYRDRNDQLATGMRGDKACVQCHVTIVRKGLPAHTHHAPGSTGSRCYNCHMPYTSFGVLTAVRSHRVTSPRTDAVAAARPNACNLCHLDRTFSWTAETLARWYRQPTVALGLDHRRIAAGVLWTLRGDAVQRAVAAWSMGWEPARRAAGLGWAAPFLAELLMDDYSAVRFVAGKTLSRLKGFASIQYDYVADPAERSRAAREVLARWRAGATERLRERHPHVLLDERGRIRAQEKARLLSSRDRRPVAVQE